MLNVQLYYNFCKHLEKLSLLINYAGFVRKLFNSLGGGALFSGGSPCFRVGLVSDTTPVMDLATVQSVRPDNHRSMLCDHC